MIGTVFPEDGEYEIVLKLGWDGWPLVRRFRSEEEMFESFQAVNVPGQITDFGFARLQSKGRLMSLPGRAQDWVQFAR